MSDAGKIDDGGAAFATPSTNHGVGYYTTEGQPGLTKRDYFAAAALTGLLAANATYGGATDDRTALAGDALAFADALIASSKTGGQS